MALDLKALLGMGGDSAASDGAGSASTPTASSASLFSDPMFMAGLQILSNGMVRRKLGEGTSPLAGVPELLSSLDAKNQTRNARMTLAKQMGIDPAYVADDATFNAAIQQKQRAQANAFSSGVLKGAPGYGDDAAAGGPQAAAPGGAGSGATGAGAPMGNLGESRQAFIDGLMPKAIEAAKQTGVDPRIIVAQAALESGWGKSAPGNNLFGIKSHGQAGGNTLATTEVVDGQPVRTTDSFRAYASPEDSVKGYADFINSNPRYGALKSAQGLDEQVAALQKSGYASDPNYGAKIRQIAAGINLPNMTSDLVQRGTPPGEPQAYAQTAPGRPLPAGVDPTSLVKPAIQQDGTQVASSDPQFVPQGGAPAPATPPGPSPTQLAAAQKVASGPAPKSPDDVRGATSQRAQAVANLKYWSSAIMASGAYGADTQKAVVAAAQPYLDVAKKYLEPTEIQKNLEAAGLTGTPQGQQLMIAALDKRPEVLKEYDAARADGSYTGGTMGFINNKLERGNAKGEQAQASENGKILSKSLMGPLATYADSTEGAHQRAQDLGGMFQSLSNPEVYTGAGAQLKQQLKMGVQGLAKTFGLPDNVANDQSIADAESFGKFANQIVGQQARGAFGNRTTNFGMSLFQKANPNLGMSWAGNYRMVGIGQQLANREEELGQEARHYMKTNGQSANIDDFNNTIVKKYDQANPITDPITGQVLTGKETLPDPGPNWRPGQPAPKAASTGDGDGKATDAPSAPRIMTQGQLGRVEADQPFVDPKGVRRVNTLIDAPKPGVPWWENLKPAPAAPPPVTASAPTMGIGETITKPGGVTIKRIN